jgi:hypothetical protein
MGGSIQAPKPLEIHLSDFVVRRIDTYVEDFCDAATQQHLCWQGGSGAENDRKFMLSLKPRSDS